MRRLVLAIAVLLLLGLAWTGIKGGLELLRPSHTQGQKVQAFAQMAFGVFALLSVVTVFWTRRWWPMVGTGFAFTLALAAGLFSVFWNRASMGVGFVSGVVALLVALAIIWLVRFGARGLTRA